MRGTRGRRVLVPLAAAALCLGLFSAEALAGKKKATTVTFFSGAQKVNGAGKVTAKGSLSTVSACRPARGVKLLLTDAGRRRAGDARRLHHRRGRELEAPGAAAPDTVPSSAPVYVKVKATKRTVGKFVCKAGFSPVIQLR